MASDTSADRSIEQVTAYWNARPCNIRHSNKQVGTRDYFEEVAARKYFVEPHIIKFANFEKCAGLRVLEVGCGIGTAMQSFMQAGVLKYVGIDISDSSIEIAKKRRQVYGFSEKQCVLQCANIEEFNPDFENEFDLVYSFGVLHHTPNIRLAISNCRRYLRPSGTFKLMLYATNSWKNFKIKEGLDQYEAQAGVPIANTYTHDEVYSLLHPEFNGVFIDQTHIFPYKIEEYKKYEYVLEDYFACMPKELFACLEKNLGFHLCITCTEKRK
jgi:2-polyprenyl-3-methyl-5-hydroxy-6-metoxy-1,4-benzoquinol methylase